MDTFLAVLPPTNKVNYLNDSIIFPPLWAPPELWFVLPKIPVSPPNACACNPPPGHQDPALAALCRLSCRTVTPVKHTIGSRSWHNSRSLSLSRARWTVRSHSPHLDARLTTLLRLCTHTDCEAILRHQAHLPGLTSSGGLEIPALCQLEPPTRSRATAPGASRQGRSALTAVSMRGRRPSLSLPATSEMETSARPLLMSLRALVNCLRSFVFVLARCEALTGPD